MCKFCKRVAIKQHYERNKPDYVRRAKAHTAKRRIELSALVREIKNRPCQDCGQTFPYYVMDFDHLPGTNKVAYVSRMTNTGVGNETILSEVRKCEVVCANCHRIRTHTRRQQSLLTAKSA